MKVLPLPAHNLEHGFLLIDDCMGHWKLLPVELDYHVMGLILERCERAVANSEAIKLIRQEKPDKWEESLPLYHPDTSVCLKCWAYGRVCFPPMDHKGMVDLTAEAQDTLIPILDRRGEVEEAHREFESLDKEAKKFVRGMDQTVVGHWLIQGKEEIRRYKAKEATEQKIWRTEITRIGDPK